MAGVKGKSGGPRINSGGARPGAGRKPKAAAAVKSAKGEAVTVTLEPQACGGALKRSNAKSVLLAEMDMLAMLQAVALGKVEASTIQVRAAIAAVQYTHVKRADGGKKDDQHDAAKKAGAGKFGASAPPLKVVGGSKA